MTRTIIPPINVSFKKMRKYVFFLVSLFDDDKYVSLFSFKTSVKL